MLNKINDNFTHENIDFQELLNYIKKEISESKYIFNESDKERELMQKLLIKNLKQYNKTYKTGDYSHLAYVAYSFQTIRSTNEGYVFTYIKDNIQSHIFTDKNIEIPKGNFYCSIKNDTHIAINRHQDDINVFNNFNQIQCEIGISHHNNIASSLSYIKKYTEQDSTNKDFRFEIEDIVLLYNTYNHSYNIRSKKRGAFEINFVNDEVTSEIYKGGEDGGIFNLKYDNKLNRFFIEGDTDNKNNNFKLEYDPESTVFLITEPFEYALKNDKREKAELKEFLQLLNDGFEARYITYLMDHVKNYTLLFSNFNIKKLDEYNNLSKIDLGKKLHMHIIDNLSSFIECSDSIRKFKEEYYILGNEPVKPKL